MSRKHYVPILSFSLGGPLRDRQFYLALAAAPLTLGSIAIVMPALLNVPRSFDWVRVLMLLLWSPVIEEVLFRGFVQGRVERSAFGRRNIAGITTANLFASLLFSVAHLIHQTPVWAVLVFIPSLAFGYFRTRHGTLTGPVMLHGTYNGFYLLFAVMA